MNDEHVTINLSKAGKGNFQRGRGRLTEALWILIEWAVINNALLPVSGVRVFLLRLFGARIGRGVRCPHPFRVKFPWKLAVGDRCWIGDGVWLYNQAQLTIGADVCVSQHTFITTGSHEVATNMDLRVDPVVIEDGAWICARCIVQKGVVIGRNGVITPGSVVHKSTRENSIYGGNPVRYIRPRFE